MPRTITDFKFPVTKLILSLTLLTLTSCGGGSTDDGGTAGGGGTGGDTGGGTGGGGGNPKSDYSLFIQQGIVNILDSPDTNLGAIQLNVWGFSSVETTPAGNIIVPGVTIDATQGKPVTVDVKNNLSTAHNFSFVNLPAVETDATASNSIAVGTIASYTITPTQSGIYLYQDALNNEVNRSLGLYGVMIVRPDTALGNVVWPGGPTFTKEVTWVIADLDYKNYNQVAINNGANDAAANVNTASYKANYFLMNGMNGFQAMADPSTTIKGTKGETVLVRIANAGQYSQSLHFHGNHFQVISRNGIRLNEFESQDTINVKPNQTAMVLYTIDQIGHYPMHVHTAQMETGGGVYLNGTAAMIIGK